MSDSFFKINRGITLEPQSGGDPASGRNGDIYYNDSLNKFRIFQNGSWVDLGSGSGGSSSYARAGQVSIPSSATSITVTFSSALPNSSYIVLAEMANSVDSNPQFQTVSVSNQTTTGFTATWNAGTDSANYILSYIVPGNLVNMAQVPVSAGATSITATFPIPFPGTTYSVVATLQNFTDASPQFQPVIVIAQTATTFTAEWNDPTDSANYVLVYQATGYA